MKKISLVLLLLVLFITGCASVPMESNEAFEAAKEFLLPPQDKTGIYVYRESKAAPAMGKILWLDNECLGTSIAKVFFYKQIKGNREISLKTQSEFSPNEIKVYVESGKNYYFRQYIKTGLFIPGSGLMQVAEERGQKDISKLGLATLGICKKQSP